jgi:dihydroorotase
MVDLMSAGPARVYGALRKGRIAAGFDADFSIVDLRRERVIEESWIASPVGWTPFAGKRVTGWPIVTVVRGAVVMREDEVLGAPSGRCVAFRS